MDVVLNDESLNGQYTEEEFVEFCRDNLLPMLRELEKYGASLYKDHSTYSRMVTNEKMVYDILHIKGNPILDRMKSYLIQLTRDPFWRDSIETDLTKKYKCDILDVPNCITETYARNGMLLSFKDERFMKNCIEIICDGSTYQIRNIPTYEACRSHLLELGYLVVWTKNSFMVESIGYKFEIRFNEGHHNVAHFHLSNSDEEVSVSIPDADILEGETLNKRVLVSWALSNMKNIVELWNRIHPEMRITYG